MLDTVLLIFGWVSVTSVLLGVLISLVSRASVPSRISNEIDDLPVDRATFTTVVALATIFLAGIVILTAKYIVAAV